MRPSFVAAVVLPALFSAASAAPATGSTSTKVPVEVDVYFGPIRDTEASEDVQRAQSLSGDVTIMEDPIYCGNTQLGWFDDMWSARDQYCGVYQNTVVPRGYELYITYQGDHGKTRVGYRNTHGGQWIIKWQECQDWLTEVVNRCYRNTAYSFGGWKGVSSGRVEIQPQ